MLEIDIKYLTKVTFTSLKENTVYLLIKLFPNSPKPLDKEVYIVQTQEYISKLNCVVYIIKSESKSRIAQDCYYILSAEHVDNHWYESSVLNLLYG